MRINGWQGVTRAKKVRTTDPDPEAKRAPDLVDRQFAVAAPNELVVADFTHVRLSTGMFVYTAFVIDAFADPIVGWECAASKQPPSLSPLSARPPPPQNRQGNSLDGTIHHSDAGSQYTSVRFGEALLLAGMTPSIGSVGDAYDNALCETIIGLYKTECMRKDSPFRTGPLDRLADVELLTADWVHWYNNQPPHAPTGANTPGGIRSGPLR